ncbi:zona pellucida sperm-binding protein 3-like [Hemicordylus capensis]|uniref:zona pellucida sperm-binding protein 3-like n=1 Tax=Hemicordylus capensis TaxID=884348 RepID=UPI0023038973|nr:zona pellucida sperm-binding protein 3-like [Hemicordylus capensis]
MWWSKGIGCLVLCCLIDAVICANLWDFSRHVPESRQLPSRANNLIRQSEWWPSSLQPVTVQCQEAQMVVMIHRDLFRTGHLIQAADLSLGPQACHYTYLSTSGDLVIFEVGLHECGTKLQTTLDSLIYRTSLYYNPGPASNPIIVRNSPMEIPIECRYPRRDNVSSNAIKPTWMPFSLTMSGEGMLHFSLRLMTDDWSAERASTVYQLGDYLHIQAAVYSGNHVPLRLFVDSCMATLTPGSDSIPQYAILDFHGCLVDGRAHDVTSAFIIPRPQPETLQFLVETFRFAGETRNLIYIACHLKVTAVDKEPDLLNKACWFNNQRNTWLPIEGSKDICDCCEAGSCGSSEGQLRTTDLGTHRSPRHGDRVLSESAIIDISKGEMEADLLVGPLLVFDTAWDHQRDQIRTEERVTEVKSRSPVIEAEAESAVGLQFILNAYEELKWLVDAEENVTSKEEMPHMVVENSTAAKLLSDADEGSGDLPLPVGVAKMSLQGIASEKGTLLGRLLTIAAGILMFVLLSYISWNTYLIC